MGGLPTTAACPPLPTSRRRMLYRGTVARGGGCRDRQDQLDQFATGLVGVRSPYGVPRNALDHEIVPEDRRQGPPWRWARGSCPLRLAQIQRVRGVCLRR